MAHILPSGWQDAALQKALSPLFAAFLSTQGVWSLEEESAESSRPPSLLEPGSLRSDLLRPCLGLYRDALGRLKKNTGIGARQVLGPQDIVAKIKEDKGVTAVWQSHPFAAPVIVGWLLPATLLSVPSPGAGDSSLPPPLIAPGATKSYFLFSAQRPAWACLAVSEGVDPSMLHGLVAITSWRVVFTAKQQATVIEVEKVVSLLTLAETLRRLPPPLPSPASASSSSSSLTAPPSLQSLLLLKEFSLSLTGKVISVAGPFCAEAVLRTAGRSRVAELLFGLAPSSSLSLLTPVFTVTVQPPLSSLSNGDVSVVIFPGAALFSQWFSLLKTGLVGTFHGLAALSEAEVRTTSPMDAGSDALPWPLGLGLTGVRFFLARPLHPHHQQQTSASHQPPSLVERWTRFVTDTITGSTATAKMKKLSEQIFSALSAPTPASRSSSSFSSSKDSVLASFSPSYAMTLFEAAPADSSQPLLFSRRLKAASFAPLFHLGSKIEGVVVSCASDFVVVRTTNGPVVVWFPSSISSGCCSSSSLMPAQLAKAGFSFWSPPAEPLVPFLEQNPASSSSSSSSLSAPASASASSARRQTSALAPLLGATVEVANLSSPDSLQRLPGLFLFDGRISSIRVTSWRGDKVRGAPDSASSLFEAWHSALSTAKHAFSFVSALAAGSSASVSSCSSSSSSSSSSLAPFAALNTIEQKFWLRQALSTAIRAMKAAGSRKLSLNEGLVNWLASFCPNSRITPVFLTSRDLLGLASTLALSTYRFAVSCKLAGGAWNPWAVPIAQDPLSSHQARRLYRDALKAWVGKEVGGSVEGARAGLELIFKVVRTRATQHLLSLTVVLPNALLLTAYPYLSGAVSASKSFNVATTDGADSSFHLVASGAAAAGAGGKDSSTQQLRLQIDIALPPTFLLGGGSSSSSSSSGTGGDTGAVSLAPASLVAQAASLERLLADASSMTLPSVAANSKLASAPFVNMNTRWIPLCGAASDGSFASWPVEITQGAFNRPSGLPPVARFPMWRCRRVVTSSRPQTKKKKKAATSVSAQPMQRPGSVVPDHLLRCIASSRSVQSPLAASSLSLGGKVPFAMSVGTVLSHLGGLWSEYWKPKEELVTITPPPSNQQPQAGVSFNGGHAASTESRFLSSLSSLYGAQNSGPNSAGLQAGRTSITVFGRLDNVEVSCNQKAGLNGCFEVKLRLRHDPALTKALLGLYSSDPASESTSSSSSSSSFSSPLREHVANLLLSTPQHVDVYLTTDVSPASIDLEAATATTASSSRAKGDLGEAIFRYHQALAAAEKADNEAPFPYIDDSSNEAGTHAALGLQADLARLAFKSLQPLGAAGTAGQRNPLACQEADPKGNPLVAAIPSATMAPAPANPLASLAINLEAFSRLFPPGLQEGCLLAVSKVERLTAAGGRCMLKGQLTKGVLTEKTSEVAVFKSTQHVLDWALGEPEAWGWRQEEEGEGNEEEQDDLPSSKPPSPCVVLEGLFPRNFPDGASPYSPLSHFDSHRDAPPGQCLGEQTIASIAHGLVPLTVGYESELLNAPRGQLPQTPATVAPAPRVAASAASSTGSLLSLPSARVTGILSVRLEWIDAETGKGLISEASLPRIPDTAPLYAVSFRERDVVPGEPLDSLLGRKHRHRHTFLLRFILQSDAQTVDWLFPIATRHSQLLAINREQAAVNKEKSKDAAAKGEQARKETLRTGSLPAGVDSKFKDVVNAARNKYLRSIHDDDADDEDEAGDDGDDGMAMLLFGGDGGKASRKQGDGFRGKFLGEEQEELGIVVPRDDATTAMLTSLEREQEVASSNPPASAAASSSAAAQAAIRAAASPRPRPKNYRPAALRLEVDLSIDDGTGESKTTLQDVYVGPRLEALMRSLFHIAKPHVNKDALQEAEERRQKEKKPEAGHGEASSSLLSSESDDEGETEEKDGGAASLSTIEARPPPLVYHRRPALGVSEREQGMRTHRGEASGVSVSAFQVNFFAPSLLRVKGMNSSSWLAKAADAAMPAAAAKPLQDDPYHDDDNGTVDDDGIAPTTQSQPSFPEELRVGIGARLLNLPPSRLAFWSIQAAIHGTLYHSFVSSHFEPGNNPFLSRNGYIKEKGFDGHGRLLSSEEACRLRTPDARVALPDPLELQANAAKVLGLKQKQKASAKPTVAVVAPAQELRDKNAEEEGEEEPAASAAGEPPSKRRRVVVGAEVTDGSAPAATKQSLSSLREEPASVPLPPLFSDQARGDASPSVIPFLSILPRHFTTFCFTETLHASRDFMKELQQRCGVMPGPAACHVPALPGSGLRLEHGQGCQWTLICQRILPKLSSYNYGARGGGGNNNGVEDAALEASERLKRLGIDGEADDQWHANRVKATWSQLIGHYTRAVLSQAASLAASAAAAPRFPPAPTAQPQQSFSFSFHHPSSSSLLSSSQAASSQIPLTYTDGAATGTAVPPRPAPPRTTRPARLLLPPSPELTAKQLGRSAGAPPPAAPTASASAAGVANGGSAVMRGGGAAGAAPSTSPSGPAAGIIVPVLPLSSTTSSVSFHGSGGASIPIVRLPDVRLRVLAAEGVPVRAVYDEAEERLSALLFGL